MGFARSQTSHERTDARCLENECAVRAPPWHDDWGDPIFCSPIYERRAVNFRDEWSLCVETYLLSVWQDRMAEKLFNTPIFSQEVRLPV